MAYIAWSPSREKAIAMPTNKTGRGGRIIKLDLPSFNFEIVALIRYNITILIAILFNHDKP